MNSEKLQDAIQALKEQFGAESKTYRQEVTLFLKPEQIVEACRKLRDEYEFKSLSSLTSVDYWPESKPRFHVVYQLYSIEHNITIRLRVPVQGIRPSIPTIETIYPNASWPEREIFDMFGINIEGHSDLRRILMPYDWEGHPLRKDYPLGYEEVQFTFNFDEIDVRKPYVEE